MKKVVLFTFIVSISLIMLVSTAKAIPVTFFGEDLGLGETTRLPSHPNADAAKTAFLSNLVGVGTETFESFSNGTPAPLDIAFSGAGTATLAGTNAYVSTVSTGTNGVGRYPISGDNYLETGSNFTVSFSQAISAFGFYGIDIGDFSGQLTITYENGDSNTINVGNTVDQQGGSVLYFGFYDLEYAFTKVTFGNTEAGWDYFGFDDLTIGTKEQVVPTPEPSIILLLGFGLLGLTGLRRK